MGNMANTNNPVNVNKANSMPNMNIPINANKVDNMSNVNNAPNMANMGKMAGKDMLLRIQELEFAAVELNLYLDNHPACKQALSDYNRITEELLQLRRAYEAEFGPITLFGFSPSEYPWQWLEGPWPWEYQD